MEETVVGYISFLYVDDINNQFVELGGAGFITQHELDTQWDSCLKNAEDTLVSSYQAVLMGPAPYLEQLDECVVHSSFIERKMGDVPITALIGAGRLRILPEPDIARLTQPGQLGFMEADPDA